jgi:hypothetical protein
MFQSKIGKFLSSREKLLKWITMESEIKEIVRMMKEMSCIE